MGRYRTYLQVENRTPDSFRTEISRVDNFDWEGNDRPDHNFHNLTIRSRQEVTKPLDVNTWATSNMYNLDFVFSDGKRLTCRIDQGIASGRKGSFGEYIPNVVEAPTIVAPDPASTAVGAAASSYISTVGNTAFLGVDTIYATVTHGERGSQYVEGDTDFYRAIIKADGNYVKIKVVPTPPL